MDHFSQRRRKEKSVNNTCVARATELTRAHTMAFLPPSIHLAPSRPLIDWTNHHTSSKCQFLNSVIFCANRRVAFCFVCAFSFIPFLASID
jgi:hypothetical protein